MAFSSQRPIAPPTRSGPSTRGCDGRARPGAPWFGSAGELVAGAYLKLDRPQEAGRLFAAIAKDKKVPDSIRSRAVQMAGSLGVDAVQDVPAAGATQEGNP